MRFKAALAAKFKAASHIVNIPLKVYCRGRIQTRLITKFSRFDISASPSHWLGAFPQVHTFPTNLLQFRHLLADHASERGEGYAWVGS
jgi:hypothetical protein